MTFAKAGLKGLCSLRIPVFNEEYKKILFPDGSSTNYWIASRVICPGYDDVRFAIMNIEYGYTQSVTMINSGSEEYYFGENALFPVVSLKANVLSGNDSDGWEIK